MSETETFTQLVLPLQPADFPIDYVPYITIDGRDAMEGVPPYDTEEEASSMLFFNLNLLSVMLNGDGANFEVTRRDAISFTAYLFTPESGAQVVRGGVAWVAKQPELTAQ